MRRLALSASVMFLVVAPACAEEPKYADRWVYCPQNLLVDKNVDELIRLMERAGKAGYTGIVLADYKFNILGRMPDRYFQNVDRVKKAAAAHKLELIPCVFPIGYSDGLLTHDPNLAEGLPVKDAPFVVRGKEVVPAGEQVRLLNGGFEDAKGDKVAGYGLQDGPGKFTFVDREEAHGGKQSLRMQEANGNCRVSQRVKVRPWTAYRLSCWIKSKDFKSGGFKLLAIGATGRPLTFHEGRPKRDQGWGRIDVVFNSLGESEAAVYVGAWGGLKGALWVDDFELVELGLVNVLRRPGCPLTITSADGKTAYEEGKDFLPVKDEEMHKAVSRGEWSFAHAPPTIKLAAASRIKDGDRVRVGWYHPVRVHGEQMMCSLSEPRVFELLEDQAKRVNELFKPKTLFMQHDEIRVAGWDKLAEASGKTPGQLLADNARKCVQILKAVNPTARIVVWSDMFDPHHNAVDNYYLVNGSLKGSWEGLTKNVMIANWNGGKAAESLKWFADRGHPLVIAGYYDGGNLDNFRRWDTAAKDVKAVHGFMYTTWHHDYSQLEEYAKALLRK
jgi:hypothetical protein